MDENQITTVIVPTPVGVNRRGDGSAAAGGDCPHARGGEPDGKVYRIVTV